MDFSHTKVKYTLVAFSCATLLATYMNDSKASAATVESDVTNGQIEETQTNEVVETTEPVEANVIVEVTEEVPESEIEEQIIQEVEWTVEAFAKTDTTIQGKGLPLYKIILQDDQGTFITETVVDDQGLFILELPTEVTFQKLFITVFNLEDELVKEIEVAIEGEEVLPEEEVATEEIVADESVADETSEEVIEEELVEEQEEVKEVVKEEIKEEAVAPVKETLEQKTAVLSATPVSTNGKTYYYIQSGDTLNSLAKHFGVTTAQLQTWNGITNANSIYVGQLISVDGKNDYHTINKEDKEFATSAEFVKHLAGYASQVAPEYGLYSSVMVAQAALESGYGQSGLAELGNNLFGIKGTYEGNSIVMRTWEEVNGEVIWINAHFRLYPSYYESLVDNADLLKNGLYYTPDFYKGTWVENTKSYKDSTAWLTGRYATDSSYGTKLNSIIEYWDLTEYDKPVQKYDEIYSSKTTNYQAQIIQGGHTLATSPWGTEGSQTVYNSSNYLWKTYKVVGEMETSRGSWVQLAIGGQKLWMDKRGVAAETITSSANVNYQAQITRSGDSLNTLPWGVSGYQTVANTSGYVGETVRVLQEATTPRAHWAKIRVGGRDLWVDLKALTPEAMTNTKSVNYEATITRSGDSISTLPWGVKGFQVTDNSRNRLNTVVRVVEETTTPRARWARIELNGQNLGWIDINALETKGLEPILSSTATVYMAEVTQGRHTLDTAPWGTKGFKTVGYSTSVVGTTVKVEEVATTERGTWAKFKWNGQFVWMDKSGLTAEAMSNTQNTSYQAKITRSGDSISTLPWGVEGFKVTGKSADYLNQTVVVRQETTTPRATWANIELNGQSLGWIDIKALNTKGLETILSSEKTDYQAKIVQGGHTLDTSPWGTVGFKTVGNSRQHVGKTVKVVEVATTSRATWAKIKLDSQYLWMDIRGLQAETMTNTVSTNYTATITRTGDTITTLPWGVKGYAVTAYSQNYLNQKVTVLQETTTPRAKWAYVSIGNTVAGWIDIRALRS
ncbi:GW dipeptide domain-containing protein [Jeotgalibaca sp. A127]|uniref:GW dipeptide domain-containing protein n=1 Tax=Jeotgalibaca sp. A127 TaxID=3457324 RepID=UPI003FD2E02B